MNLKKEVKSNIHLYVILELTIKSVQHDQKLFESFKVKRPYLSLCNQQLEVLSQEFKQLSNTLYKQGVKYEKYQRINHNDCIYSFICHGDVILFQYRGDALKEQVERKIKLTWQSMMDEDKHESI